MKTFLAVAAVAASALCFGQYFTRFEPNEGYSSSVGGTVVDGQMGWYNPVDGSAPGLVFNYFNNALGVVQSPAGGISFLGTVTNAAAAAIVSRAQRDVSFGPGQWQVRFDFCPIWNGQPPSEDSLGSFSLQPSVTSNYFQTLYRWPDVNNPTSFTMQFGVTDAVGLPSGTQITTYRSAGAAWSNLPVNHWYRSSITWDFASNRILSVSIQDLTTGGVKTTFTPTDWYLAGGAANFRGRETPTALRFFSGGTSNGNAIGHDNVAVIPVNSTGRLAPIAEQIVFGTTNSGGNLASWAADDNDARKICRFFAPPNAVTRANISYLTPKTSLSRVISLVKVAKVTPGSQVLTILVENKRTNLFDDTNVTAAPIVNGKTYVAVPRGDPSDYVDALGHVRVQLQTRPTSGIRDITFPCISYEFAQLEVIGQ